MLDLIHLFWCFGHCIKQDPISGVSATQSIKGPQRKTKDWYFQETKSKEITCHISSNIALYLDFLPRPVNVTAYGSY